MLIYIFEQNFQRRKGKEAAVIVYDLVDVKEVCILVGGPK